MTLLNQHEKTESKPNRNRGFCGKTEPKPNRSALVETVTSLGVCQRDIVNEGRGYAKTRKNREDDDQMDVRCKTE